jgi:hypothetical protein
MASRKVTTAALAGSVAADDPEPPPVEHPESPMAASVPQPARKQAAQRVHAEVDGWRSEAGMMRGSKRLEGDSGDLAEGRED